jgi:hypothetical protein
LHGIDVLISTTGFTGLALQPTLASAAAKAGVSLFVPAEFGETTDGHLSGAIFEAKLNLRKHAAEIGLPTTAYWTGLWTEWILQLGFEPKVGKVTIHGQGDAIVSTTSMADVAEFVAYTLVELHTEKLKNAEFTLEGDKIVRTPHRHHRANCIAHFLFPRLSTSLLDH